MTTNKRVFTLRLTEEDYEKIRVISERNNRSMANQIEHLVRRHIHDYEKTNGAVEVKD